jgi:hypothetical protein
LIFEDNMRKIREKKKKNLLGCPWKFGIYHQKIATLHITYKTKNMCNQCNAKKKKILKRQVFEIEGNLEIIIGLINV